MSLDAIDRYLQELDFLKERERFQQRIEQLESELRSIRKDAPIKIVKTIIENRYHPSKLPKEWVDSGLYDMVNNAINRRAKSQARVHADREQKYDDDGYYYEYHDNDYDDNDAPK